MKHRSNWMLGVLLLPAMAVPVWSQQSDDGLENVIVTGTRLEDELASLANSVTVIDTADLRARNDAQVLDALRSVPGLQVTQYGGRGGVASVFLRGGEPNFTLVMIDGVRVNDPNNTRGGSFDFSTLNVDNIQRIEVVRGPQSAVYGSDALSGVINIITRSGADELAVAMDAEIGADHYQRAGLMVSGPAGASGDYALRLSTLDDGEPVSGSSFENTAVSGKLRLAPGQNLELRLSARYADSDGTAFPEDSGGPRLAVLDMQDVRQQEDLSLAVQSRWDFAPAWSWRANATRYAHDEIARSPGVAPGIRDGVPPNGSDSELTRTEVATYVEYSGSAPVRLTAGVDFRRERGISLGFVEFFPGFQLPNNFDLERDIIGLFAESRFDASTGLSIQASLRSDDPDQNARETTVKAGVLYQLPNRHTRIFANYGEGFKVPSFFALGSPLVGNPGLRPENSKSLDVGIMRSLLNGGLSITASLFKNRFTDLIDFDFELFTNVNRNRVDTSGGELSFDYRANEHLSVRGHATYLDIDVLDSETTLRQRPDWRGGVGVRWQAAPGWLLDLDWLSVGETFDSAIPTGGLTLDSYQRVDVSLSWSGQSNLSVGFAVDNVFDANYEEAIGFPAPGIRPRLSVSYQF